MRVQEIRELSDQDLQRELESTRREMMNLRFRQATKQLTNTAEVRTARKNLARLKTILREREIQESAL